MAGLLSPSSGVESCPPCDLEIFGGASLQVSGVVARFGAVACCLFIAGLRCPQRRPPIILKVFPQGITLVRPLAHLSCGAPLRRATGGTREAKPRFAIPQPTRKIRIVPRLMRRFGKSSTTTERTPPAERKALWVSKS